MRAIWSLFGLLLIIKVIAAAKRLTDPEVMQIVGNMLKNYDVKLRPNYTGKPVRIGVDCSVLSFGKVDALNMAFTLDMFFRQTWSDHRLRHKLNQTLTLTIGTRHPADIIWVPDTVFVNSVTSSMHHVTVNNHKLDVNANGKILWGTRVTVSPACKLDLRSYPMDTQQCHFELVSYGHSTKHIIYNWLWRPGIKLFDPKMAQFDVQGFTTKAEIVKYVAGKYSVLTATFTFKRLVGHAILQIYIPCVAVVCVSWISLWINRNSTPARVALCITTLLTISTLWSGANSTLPRVSYIKAIDVYLMTSFCFVLCTLLEYVLALNFDGVIPRKKKRPKKSLFPEVEQSLLEAGPYTPKRFRAPKEKKTRTWIAMRDTEEFKRPYFPKHTENGGNTLTKDENKGETAEFNMADYIENGARIMFPFAFFIFNCAYWFTYVKF